MTPDTMLNRLIRIETRLAKLQQYLKLRTKLTTEDILGSPFNDGADMEFRVVRIETRIYQLLDAMNLNPKTGQPR